MKDFNSRKLLFPIIFICICFYSFAQQTAEKLVIEHNYLLYLPEGYESDTIQVWPMMIFLHGAGETGEDVEKVKWLGPPAMIERGRQYPFIVVSPQSAEHGWKPDFLYKLIIKLKEDLRIDEDRVYLTGLSMGGYGTWNTAISYPELFAAIIPICGGGSPSAAWRITMPVWCFHGEDDDVVPFSQSQEMIDALKEYNPEVKFTAYPGIAHDSWTETYNNEEVYEWMLSHKRTKQDEVLLEPEVLEQYVGKYKLSDDDILEVSIQEGTLQIKTSSGYLLPVKYPTQKDKFILNPYTTTSYCLFERDAHDKVFQLTLVEGPHRTGCERVNE